MSNTNLSLLLMDSEIKEQRSKGLVVSPHLSFIMSEGKGEREEEGTMGEGETLLAREVGEKGECEGPDRGVSRTEVPLENAPSPTENRCPSLDIHKEPSTIPLTHSRYSASDTSDSHQSLIEEEQDEKDEDSTPPPDIPLSTRGVPQVIPIKRIRPNPFQLRKVRREDVEDLITSIREFGVLEPLLVVPRGIRKYMLIAGHRRLEAAKSLGMVDVPCMVLDLNEKEFLTVSLIENLQRSDLTPLEEARAIRLILDETGINYRDLAKRIGKSIGYISERISLLDLPQDLQTLVMEGILPLKKALVIGRIPVPKVRAKYIEKASGIDLEQLREQVDQEFARRQRRREKRYTRWDIPEELREFARHNGKVRLFRNRISIRFDSSETLRAILYEILHRLPGDREEDDLMPPSPQDPSQM